MAASVRALRVSPVKGLLQHAVPALELVAGGIADDRRFVIVDADDRALYGANLLGLAGATARWDADGDVLAIAFADGEVVRAPVVEGEALEARAYGPRVVPVRLLDGPWAAALSAREGRPLRLGRAPVGVASPGALTLVSSASLQRVAEQLELPGLDVRRFKMSIEIDGVEAYAEDAWAGRDIRVGEAVLRIGGQVPRCVLTTLDPDTLLRDADTLRAILAHRAPMAGGEPPLGVYATVVRAAPIRLGDQVVATL